MKKTCFILLFNLMFFFAVGQSSDWQTDYEKSGYLDTPRYAETIKYCKRLASSSNMITYTTFGKSPQGRDLPLLIIDNEGLSEPYAIHAAGKAIVLIEACIHPGESEGKDAGMMLVRDLMLKYTPSGSLNTTQNKGVTEDLLKNLSILFIPIFNVDGHERFGPFNRINQNGPREMGWRVTSNNLNLNRDFVKADAPEMKQWLMFFNSWMPDFFIDIHTTDGADYQYVLTYLMEIYGDMDEGLTAWSRDQFIPNMEKQMVKQGYPIFPYVDFRNWHDPRSGLITEVAPPMLSQGYTSIRNRPGLLIETHMLKPYRQRVDATYACLVTSLEFINKEAHTLRSLVAKADEYLCSEAFLKKPFPLQFVTSLKDSVMVDFLGMEYTAVHSDLSGGTWFQYSKTPTTFKLPYFKKTEVAFAVNLPYAYVIPVQWTEVIERLQLHGIQMIKTEKPIQLKVTSHRFVNPKWQSNPFEGRHPMTEIEYTDVSEERWFPAGSVIVKTMQPAGRLIPHLLEPKGDGSLLYWGFFDAVFEQKEYGESYVMEKLAREMLANDPELRSAFEAKKRSDPSFMKNPWNVLNWFYNQSAYADSQYKSYPIGKISSPDQLQNIQ